MMRHFPFSYCPDSFFLMLPRSGSGISICRFESAWGTTDEMLCYANGVFFGLLYEVCDQDDRLVVVLLPNLDPQRKYDWPDSDEFRQTLLSLILSVPSAYLHCERDTDQDPLPHLGDETLLVECIKNVVEFCIGGAIPCPTFAYGRPRLAIPYAEQNVVSDCGGIT